MASLLVDPRQTHRVVLLIDLYPLFHLQDSSPFVSAVLSAVKTIVSSPCLFSTSLFAYKLFFSSLSPLTSSSKIHKLLGKASSVSFDLPAVTFTSLASSLRSVASLLSLSDTDRLAVPRTSLVAASLRQILYDYPWETAIHDPKGTQVLTLRSNLVLLFSPFPRRTSELPQFVGAELDDEKALSDKFSLIFSGVNEGFVNRDIHLCWVDINFDEDCKEGGGGNENGSELELFEKGIKSVGWGSCCTDAIILGPVLVPFELVFPKIACSVRTLVNPSRVELSLEILDVNKKPLVCNFDIELLINLRIKGKFFGGYAPSKISIQKLLKNNGVLRIKEDSVSDVALLRGFSPENEKEKKNDKLGDFFMDKVLDMLRIEKSEFVAGKPTWPLLLNFLHKEGVAALVSLLDAKGSSVIGILRPFTIHSAVLCLLDGGTSTETLHEATADSLCSNMFTVSKFENSSLCNAMSPTDLKRKRHKRNPYSYKDLTWHSFRQAVLSCHFEGMDRDAQLEFDMEEAYFARECHNSKKLRFLKCWMKQMKKSKESSQIRSDETKDPVDVKEEFEKRCKIVDSQQESQETVSPSVSVGGYQLSQTKSGEAQVVCCLETPKEFFESVCQKIQQGVDSEEVDLGIFAERIVDSSIYWLHGKCETDASENLAAEESKDFNCITVFNDLVNLLLEKPKNLVTKYKGCSSPRKKVRVHELQILFRMEILQSKVGASIEEAGRRKFVKEICSLLENIVFNLQGGIFGGESLVEFAGRILKKRYARSLGEVIHRVYTKMEFLSSDGEDEDATSSMHDSKENENDRAQEGNDIGGQPTFRPKGITDEQAIPDEAAQGEDDLGAKKKMQHEQQEHELRLIEARERRERARRFASFTSWVPDLQRVWAPKQQSRTSASGKRESSRKPSRNKQRRRGPHHGYDVVCETPSVGIKRVMQTVGSSGRAEKRTNSGITSCEPAKSKKALFQTD
ncbi:uncharacterized protein [Aristolochia californica]|uniref:uncharacterized protein n=1 Tax=Aristolochia californica TaxID=171875 RepID=UPI0035E131B7